MGTFSFHNAVALVTGSSRGIGSSIALRFARAGADIVLNYRKPGGKSQAQAERLKGEVEALGRTALVVQADIADHESVRSLFRAVRERFGRLDVLVLNAARAPFKPLENLLERELRQLIETNYLGNLYCVQEAIPLMEDAGGKVVFISSLGSRFFNPAYPLGSMKAAMESAVRDFAETLAGKRISVNAVCGGIVKTDSFKVLRQYWDELAFIPEELFVEPDEIADVVLFLCDPISRAVRGQTIVVDRGLSNRLYRPIPQKAPVSRGATPQEVG